MLTLTEASEIAQILESVFSEVVLDGTRKPITVKAKGWKPLGLKTSCDHKVHIVAKGVNAHIASGYLTNHPATMKYTRIEYCQECEVVFEAQL